jgi:hypothetical protein
MIRQSSVRHRRRAKPRQSPDSGSLACLHLRHWPLICMKMGSGFAEQDHMVREPCMGGKKQWCSTSAISQMDRGSLQEEVAEDLKRR